MWVLLCNLKKGEALEAADGRSIPVASNEVARMDYLLNKDHSKQLNLVRLVRWGNHLLKLENKGVSPS